MGIIKGSVYFTRNLDEAMNLLRQANNTKCLFVGDSMGKYDMLFNQYGIIPASILMPDLIGMEADINGTPQEFRAKYFDYLNSEGPKSMISTIITALYQGKNIIFLVPPEASGLDYPDALMSYMFNYHGITVASGEKKLAFAYNPNFDLANANCMYMFNTIGPAEYLLIAGPNFNMLDKLCYDTQMGFGPNTNPASVKAYFEQWRQNMLRSGGKPTTKAFGFTLN